MRWIYLEVAALAACTLAACGGSTTRSAGTGGSGGTSSGGCACSAGFHCVPLNGSYTCVPESGAGGSAGVAGAPGTGGVAGAAGAPGGACSAAQTQVLTTPTPVVGFWPRVSGALTGGSVTAVTLNALTLNTNLGQVTLYWAGPSLAGVFQPGASVTAGALQSGWDYVASAKATAATYTDANFVGDGGPLPPTPFTGPQLTRGVECTFDPGVQSCGVASGPAAMLDIEATTGAGTVRVGVGDTGQIAGWQIYNARTVRYPNYTTACAAAQVSSSVVTALGPAASNGP